MPIPINQKLALTDSKLSQFTKHSVYARLWEVSRPTRLENFPNYLGISFSSLQYVMNKTIEALIEEGLTTSLSMMQTQ
ncbi:hypothetical protein B5X24_HaOG207516 [Helicoverpa armigera]|nr:hypothetical protein B5X24_HaOG207516 [Helicoverpa armigera]